MSRVALHQRRDGHRGRVLVLGDNDLASLQIVRSLGRRGLEVHLVCYERQSVTSWSRLVRKRYAFGHPVTDTARFVSGLLKLLKRIDFQLIVPTSDSSITPLMSYRKEIEALSPFVVPNAEGYEATFNKLQTLEWAIRLGIPIPPTRLVCDFEDAQRELSISSHAFPLILKPCCSLSVGQASRNEVVIVDSAAKFAPALKQAVCRGPVLVQEFCRGHQVGFGVLAGNGEIHAAFQHRQLHEQGSLATYRCSVPIDPQLLRHAREFCSALNWTGPALFEYIIDPTTRQEVLLEVNGRFWGALGLAIFAGIDFPSLLYDMLVLGRTSKTFVYRVPIYARHTCRDLFWWRAALLRLPPSRLAEPLTVHDALREAWNLVSLRERPDVESLTDPVPGIVAWFHVVRNSGRAALAQLRWGHPFRRKESPASEH